MNINVSKFLGLYIYIFFSIFQILLSIMHIYFGRRKNSIISWVNDHFLYNTSNSFSYIVWHRTNPSHHHSSSANRSNLTHLPIFILHFLHSHQLSLGRKSRTIPTIRAYSSSRHILSSSRSILPRDRGCIIDNTQILQFACANSARFQPNGS